MKNKIPFFLSGILLCVSFVFNQLYFISFFALVPMMMYMMNPVPIDETVANSRIKSAAKRRLHKKYATKSHSNQATAKSISIGIIIFSISFIGPSIYWFYEFKDELETTTFNGILIITLAIILLCLYMSIFWIIPFSIWKFVRRSPVLDVLSFAFLFILGEYLQGQFYPTAFPWCRIGTIIAPFTAFIQSASLLGGLFVSFLVIIINGFIALLLMSKKLRYLFVVTAVFLVNVAFGVTTMLLDKVNEDSDKHQILLVQGNYPGLDKWKYDPDVIANSYIDEAERAATGDTTLIVFPECFAFFDLYSENEISNRVMELSRKKPVLAGINEYRSDGEFNSAVLIEDGKISESYSKRRLVPFGERLIFEPILEPLLPEYLTQSYYTEGDKEFVPSIMTSESSSPIGVNICFESVFPEISRTQVRQGAEILTVLTDDSWFGSSVARKEHLNHSIMRAAENKRYVLRCANTGITCVISPTGVIESRLDTDKIDSLSADVRYLTEQTVYNRIGDVVVIPSVLIFFFGIYRVFKSRKSK
jgi:apolipoprotein N-acyltransferase